MPLHQMFVELANAKLNRDNIGSINADSISSVPTAENLQWLGLTADQSVQLETVLVQWPAGLLDVLAGAIKSAVGRELPVQLSWAPGYDYEVTVWETAGTQQSMGGMTVALRSPYQQA